MTAVATLTFVHVVISLIGLTSGFIVLWGLLSRQRLERWTALFLATTIATSLTGFLFPVDHVTPGHVLGVISLVLLAIAVVARYGRQLAGGWRPAYVASAVAAQYLNFLVLVVQLFQKVPAPAFAVTQLITLAAFVALGVVAVRRFRSGVDTASSKLPAASAVMVHTGR